MNNEDQKLLGFEFWRKKLNGARLVVAPMVDQSELPWRLLSRRHGAELCYTPMYHASVFVRDPHYRKEALASCAQDRPLIVQFCANDPAMLLKAARYAEPHCEAVDLNLGCPQSIAKRGHYGAYLQNEWDLIHNMVSLLARELHVPVTCKIRVFKDIGETVRYARMLEKAGCQLLTVHGRTISEKGPLTGLASWAHIKAVRQNVNIPVFANGNIQYLGDVDRCLAETGAQGVMSAESNLHNPALFTGKLLPVWQLGEEYIELVAKHPCPLNYVRGHLFKLFQHALNVHPDLRETLGSCKSVEEICRLVAALKERSKPDVESYEADPSSHETSLPLPYWICQPYERPGPDETDEEKLQRQLIKRPLEVIAGPDMEPLSKNKLKKLRRNPKKSFAAKEDKFEKCQECGNPKGGKCVFALCRGCCRNRTYQQVADCPGHRSFIKTKMEKRAAEQGTKVMDGCHGADSSGDSTDSGARCSTVAVHTRDAPSPLSAGGLVSEPSERTASAMESELTQEGCTDRGSSSDADSSIALESPSASTTADSMDDIHSCGGIEVDMPSR